MLPSHPVPGPDVSAGFVHDGRIIYAIEYWLDTPAPTSRNLIDWLTPDGDSQNPRIESAYTGKRIASTKPGEYVKVGSKLEKVVSLSAHRFSQLPGAK
jgi:hypothetical protein